MVKLAFAFMLINAIFYALSFFATSKTLLLLLQIVSNIFFGLQYLVVKAYTGAIIVAVDTVRLLAFFFVEKFKNTFVVRLLVGTFFIVASIIAAALTWDKWYCIFPLLATIMVIISLIINNLLVIKIVGLLSCPLQLFYMLFIKSYLNLIIECGVILAETIAVVVEIGKLKKQRFPATLST